MVSRRLPLRNQISSLLDEVSSRSSSIIDGSGVHDRDDQELSLRENVTSIDRESADLTVRRKSETENDKAGISTSTTEGSRPTSLYIDTDDVSLPKSSALSSYENLGLGVATI